MNDYRCAGLTIVSELPLPLAKVAPGGSSPVFVRRKHLTPPVSLPTPYDAGGARYGPWGDGLLVLLGTSPRFLIHSDTILVDGDGPEPAIADLVVRVALGFVVQLRSLLSFHGAAVCWGGTAFALLGRRGAGKSTTSLGLVNRGWSLLSDDLVVVEPDSVVPQGPCQTRLNPDSYRLLGPQGRPVPQDSDGKWVVGPRQTAMEGRLKTIVVLQPTSADVTKTTELKGLAKLSAVLDHLHSPGGIGNPAHRLVQTSQILARVSVFRIERPSGRFALDEVLDAVESLRSKELV